MLSSGVNVIICEEMLSSEANVIMVSSGANVIIWCYHVMLSSGMITPPSIVFPGNFTHSGPGETDPRKKLDVKNLVYMSVPSIHWGSHVADQNSQMWKMSR
jgi:hypothetical protein